MARHPRWVRALLSAEDLLAVARAIGEAEAGTSAEIRVHLDARCHGDPVERAVRVFEGLGMHRTRERNGVLVYVASFDSKLAVIGDRAIHERVGRTYWEGIVALMRERFRAGRAREALLDAIADLGAVLGAHFPRRPDDQNELSDQVSAG